MTHPIIIVGTGLAGYQLAREFRKLDKTTPLLLVTADAGKYYSKPMLSTALTSGKTAESLATATAEVMAEQLTAEIITHAKVSSINPEAKTITVNEKVISYSKLVLALGADVIKPPLKGTAVDRVLSINHIYHYADFREVIKDKKRIAILGAGLIGCEFANDLSNAGYEVHVLAPVPAPLDLLVPLEVGKVLQKALEENGVHFHLPNIAVKVDETADKNFRLELSDGQILEVEAVISAIGLKPNTALAEQAGVQTNRGIIVDRFLATNISDIYALGDCAEVEGHVLPYITPLLNCSRALAKTLSGEATGVDYPAMPVTVKTPAHPIVVCPPPRGVEGHWQVEIKDHSVRALFYDGHDVLCGFVLTNECVKERASLAKQLPSLF